MKFLNELKWRDLIKEIANEQYLEAMAKDGAAFYIGVDPTADSMHIGHYMSIVASKHLAESGFKPVFVIGGLTASIGDPSGKNEERPVVQKEVISANAKRLEKVIAEVAKKTGIDNFEIINNMKFYEDMSIINLLQDYGKLFNINQMLSKESVQNRIDTGISFTEFSYQMFQAIDFLKLYEEKNVKLQLGGSDQWGNMTAGLDLIRKVHGSEKEISVITFKLITDNEGNKIGKTAGNPVWLEEERFSSYELYQYILNKNDEEAKQLLIKLTLITQEEFYAIIEEQDKNPSSRPVQKELARRLISTLHGEDKFRKAVKTSEALFKGDYESLDVDQYDSLFANIPVLENEDKSIIEIVVGQGAIQSNKMFREFMSNGAIKINGKSIEDENQKIMFLNDKVSIIQLGKKKKFIIWK